MIMEELLLGNNFDFKYFDTKDLEDFDSGCSSMPSSPSLSDFSGSSFDDFSDNFLMKERTNVNPLITIKTESDFDDGLCTDGGLLPDNDDLFSMLMNDSEFFREDISTFDDKKDNSLYDATVQEDESVTEEISVKTEQTSREESRVASSCRRRTVTIKRNSSDHTYACEEVSIDNSFEEESKDESYLEKRRRNNLAAKKSRQLKRAKEIENVKRYEKLSKENKSLQKELKKLQSLVSRLENQVKRS